MTLVPILAAPGLGGVVTALVQAWLSRRKSSAETTDVITQAAERAVGMFAADNARLRQQVADLSAKVETLTSEVHGLRVQMGALEGEREHLLAALAKWEGE